MACIVSGEVWIVELFDDFYRDRSNFDAKICKKYRKVSLFANPYRDRGKLCAIAYILHLYVVAYNRLTFGLWLKLRQLSFEALELFFRFVPVEVEEQAVELVTPASVVVVD